MTLIKWNPRFTPSKDPLGIRVGITTGPAPNKSIWENRKFQNVYFLHQALSSLSNVREVSLIFVGSAKEELSQEYRDLGLRLISPIEAWDQCDVVIIMGAIFDPHWNEEFRSRGGVIIGYHLENSYTIHSENLYFRTTALNGLITNDCDFFWMLPQYQKTNEPYLQNINPANLVRIAPSLWGPDLIKLVAHSKNYRLERNPQNPRRGLWYIAEPNISVNNSCFVPLLIADRAFQTNPALIAQLTLMNTEDIANHKSFHYLMGNSELSKNNKIIFKKREEFSPILMRDFDGLISHQFENGLNYLHYEVLYAGYPLVHNSWHHRHWGYYYEGNSVMQGVKAMEASFDKFQPAQIKKQRRELLSLLSPASPTNQRIYFNLIEEVRDFRSKAKGARCLIGSN